MVARLSIANAPIASCSSRTRVVRRDRCVECAAARCAVVVVVVVVVGLDVVVGVVDLYRDVWVSNEYE